MKFIREKGVKQRLLRLRQVMDPLLPTLLEVSIKRFKMDPAGSPAPSLFSFLSSGAV